MKKMLKKIGAFMLACLVALPSSIGSALMLRTNAETGDASVESVSAPEIPQLDNTEAVRYVGWNIASGLTRDGLSAATPLKYLTDAQKQLSTGGRIIISDKAYTDSNMTLAASSSPILITGKNTDGTYYYDPDSPDVNDQKGMIMVRGGSTLTFQGEVILSETVILERNPDSAPSYLAVASDAVLHVDETVLFARTQGEKNTRLTVDEGGVAILESAGFSSYHGSGKIYLASSLAGSAVTSSMLSDFSGDVFALDGSPLCSVFGHNIITKAVEGKYYNVCSACGDTQEYTYSIPTISNTSDKYYWANNGSGDGLSVSSPVSSVASLSSLVNNGGTVYVTQKGYFGGNATLDVGAATLITAVLDDGTDLREKNLSGAVADQNGSFIIAGGYTATFVDDVIFDKINFYSRNSTYPTIKVSDNSCMFIDEVEFKRVTANCKNYVFDVAEGSTVILGDNVVGGHFEFKGNGTIIVSRKLISNGVFSSDMVANFEGIVMTDNCLEICDLSGRHSYDGGVCQVCGAIQENAVTRIYIGKNGTGDGSNPESPSASLRTCFDRKSADPIEIVLVNDIDIGTAIVCNGNDQDVTITSMDIDGDGVYPKLSIQSYIIFKNSGAGNTITFENIEIRSDRSGTVPLFFNFNNVTFGDGVRCTLSGNYADAQYPTVYAGYLERWETDTPEKRSNSQNTEVNIASGTWTSVICGNRRSNREYSIGCNNGDMILNITGGRVLGDTKGVAVAGTGSNFYTGKIDINISGGSIEGDICGVYDLDLFVGKTLYGDYGLKGDIDISLTGGSLAGDIYAKYKSLYLQSLIRGDVTVTLGEGVSVADALTVDLRSTQGYDGETASSLTYADTLADKITYKFADVVNGTATEMGEPERIAMIGDSITYGSGSSDVLANSYPSQFSAMLNADEYTVGNFGIGGAGIFPSTGYYYNDMLTYHLVLEEFDPDIVTIALGTNDAATAGGTKGAAETFEEMYYDFAKSIASLPSKPLVLAATPILRTDSATAAARNVSIVEPAIRRSVAKMKNEGLSVEVFELNAISYAMILTEELPLPDKLHPNAEGYAILAEMFYDAVIEGKTGVPDSYYLDEVYISDNGTPTGEGSAQDPMSNYTVALARINKNGGRLVVSDTYTIAADSVMPTDITGTLTICGADADAVLVFGGNTIKLGSSTVFDNIILATTSDDPIVLGWFNNVHFTENFRTEARGKYDLSFAVGVNAYSEKSLIDISTTKTYDTVKSASSAKDLIIRIDGGSFGAVALGNIRASVNAPIGCYSGNMQVYMHGGDITGNDNPAAVWGAVSMLNLTGSIDIEIEGTEIACPFYLITRTGTLTGVTYDSSINTGTLTVSAPEDVVKNYIIECERPSRTDAQHASLRNIVINNISGDLDGDGTFTNADLALLIRYLAGAVETQKPIIRCDMNGDNKVNNRDAITLIQRLSYLDTDTVVHEIAYDSLDIKAGEYSYENGILSSVDASAVNAYALTDITYDSSKYYSFETVISSPYSGTDNAAEAGMVLGYKENGAHFVLVLNRQNISMRIVEAGKTSYNILKHLPLLSEVASINAGERTQVRAEVFPGGECLVYLNDTLVGRTTVEGLDSGRVGFYTNKRVASFSNIIVRDGVIEEPADVFSVEGAVPNNALDGYYVRGYDVEQGKDSVTIELDLPTGCFAYIDGAQINTDKLELSLDFNAIEDKELKLSYPSAGKLAIYKLIFYPHATEEQKLALDSYSSHYHYSPTYGQIGNPNGLVYNEKTGEYHLYHQHQLYGVRTSSPHWSLATSKDLVNWTEQHVVLAPDEYGYVLSGCGVIDRNNTSGLFDETVAPEERIVALYSYSSVSVGLAYSTDGGMSFTKYGEPVIPTYKYTNQFRDPKVIWFEDESLEGGGEWLMVIAGGKTHMYSSPDLINWTFAGDICGVDGVQIDTECPDLFPLALDSDPTDTKWVFTGAGDYAVVGELERGGDGIYNFTALTDKLTLLNDTTGYATQSFYNTPDGRRILMSWNIEWGASGLEGSKVWNGAQCLPMELKLTVTDGAYGVSLLPVSEIHDLAISSDKIADLSGKTVTTTETVILGEKESSACMLNVKADVSSADGFKLKVKSNGTHASYIIYSKSAGTLTFDFTKSGIAPTSPTVTRALAPDSEGKIYLYVYIDRCSVEVFTHDGRMAAAFCADPNPNRNGMSITAIGGNVILDTLEVYDMVTNRGEETYRPTYHFTREYGMLADPNGLWYDSSTGIYHMYFQSYDAIERNGTTRPSWGHATSTDLVNWTHHGYALNYGWTESGCAVVDLKNTSGLFDSSVPAEQRVVAVYSKGENGVESQWVAYSTDGGYSFTDYGKVILPEQNPFNGTVKAFRDPKVVWIEDETKANGGFWFMVIAGGRVQFYTSEDLINWEWQSALVDADGEYVVTECPDFYPLAVDGNTDNVKWVLTGGGEWYTVGTLAKNEDGKYVYTIEQDKEFINLTSPFETRGVYATQSFYIANSDRRLSVHWMVDISAERLELKDKEYNGMMSLAFESTLVTSADGKLVLTARPANEIVSSLCDEADYSYSGEIDSLPRLEGESYVIKAKLKANGAGQFGFALREGGVQKTLVYFDNLTSRLVLDTSRSGDLAADPSYKYTGGEYSKQLLPDAEGYVAFDIFVDNSGIEIYSVDGSVAGSVTVFPDADSTGIRFFTDGTVEAEYIDVYIIK